jgi:hypothetical protein
MQDGSDVVVIAAIRHPLRGPGSSQRSGRDYNNRAATCKRRR